MEGERLKREAARGSIKQPRLTKAQDAISQYPVDVTGVPIFAVEEFNRMDEVTSPKLEGEKLHSEKGEAARKD